MKRIAKFHKVSKERFTADWIDTFAQSQEEAEKVYEAIRLPKRATAGSAGYDFFAPAEFTLKPGETVKIPTGIRVEMQPEWVLKCYPRSGLGFKYRLQLNNTVGIIDSDYFYSDNEGHIFVCLQNESDKEGYFKVNITNIIKEYYKYLSIDNPNNLFFTTAALRDYHYTKQKNNAYYHIDAINLPFQNIEFYLIGGKENDKEES